MKNLNNGFLPSDADYALRSKEKEIIKKEEGLIEKEDGLIKKKQYENIENEKDNKTKFKEMLNELKNDIYDFEYNKDEIELNNFENKYTEENEINKDIEYIKENNMKLTPFKDTDENISWFKICPFELSIFEGDIWKYANNPFVYNCYKKFNHLMLGIKNEGNKESYILGIPCRFEKDFSIFGFEKFSPLDENVSLSNIENGEYGYRLLEI